MTSDDDAMIRSEERLAVSTEEQETGKVRLRKQVVTEYVTVTVPVRHEEVRLEHVPLTGDDGGEAGEAVESEADLVLYAERPVVTTETVQVERVRLGKRTVTGEETVTGAVRRERIELELDD